MSARLEQHEIEIVIRFHGVRSWSAALRDVANDQNMIIGYGPTPQLALDGMLADTVLSASHMWIERRKRKNRKLAQTDGYIGIPKRKIS